MTIEECKVMGENFASYLMIGVIALVIMAMAYHGIGKINNWIALKKVKLPKINQEVTTASTFVLAAVLLFMFSPLKPTPKETINSVVYYKGQEVVPCDKNKDTKAAFFKKKYKTMICSL